MARNLFVQLLSGSCGVSGSWGGGSLGMLLN
jgi:hypothetical protein